MIALVYFIVSAFFIASETIIQNRYDACRKDPNAQYCKGPLICSTDQNGDPVFCENKKPGMK